MNEGFTTFLERRIAAKVFNEKERHLQASGQTQAYLYMQASKAKAKQFNYTQNDSFFQGKIKSCPGWDSNPRHSAV